MNLPRSTMSIWIMPIIMAVFWSPGIIGGMWLWFEKSDGKRLLRRSKVEITVGILL